MIAAENIPNMVKETVIQLQEVQVPGRINLRRNMLRHIVIKLIKIKEKTLKATRKKQPVTNMGISIRLSANFSAEILQARRE